MSNSRSFLSRASGNATGLLRLKRIRTSLVTGESAGTFSTATAYDIFSVRAGTVLHDIKVRAVTALANNAGTPLINLGDGDDPDRFLDVIAVSELSTAGDTVSWHNDGSTEGLAKDLYPYSSDDTVDVTIDAATLNAGVIDLYVTYSSPDADAGVYVSSSNEAYGESV